MLTADDDGTIAKSDFAEYLQKGIDYGEYIQRMGEDLAANDDDKMKEYIHLNQRRMQRVAKTYEVSESLAEQVRNLEHTIWWLILTEHWCGDAAQTLPALYKIAKKSEGKIVMKLVYRDQHPQLMDAFLTEGTRSIPKLIQLDQHLNITGTWGPRPTVAQELVKRLKSDPATEPNYANELHFWYAKDKQKSIESEISQLLLKSSIKTEF